MKAYDVLSVIFFSVALLLIFTTPKAPDTLLEHLSGPVAVFCTIISYYLLTKHKR